MCLLNFYRLTYLALPGGTEWIIILIAVLLIFGGKKIPELMKGIGKGVRDFNDAKNSTKEDVGNINNERSKAGILS